MAKVLQVYAADSDVVRFLNALLDLIAEGYVHRAVDCINLYVSRFQPTLHSSVWEFFDWVRQAAFSDACGTVVRQYR